MLHFYSVSEQKLLGNGRSTFRTAFVTTQAQMPSRVPGEEGFCPNLCWCFSFETPSWSPTAAFSSFALCGCVLIQAPFANLLSMKGAKKARLCLPQTRSSCLLKREQGEPLRYPNFHREGLGLTGSLGNTVGLLGHSSRCPCHHYGFLRLGCKPGFVSGHITSWDGACTCGWRYRAGACACCWYSYSGIYCTVSFLFPRVQKMSENPTSALQHKEDVSVSYCLQSTQTRSQCPTQPSPDFSFTGR